MLLHLFCSSGSESSSIAMSCKLLGPDRATRMEVIQYWAEYAESGKSDNDNATDAKPLIETTASWSHALL